MTISRIAISILSMSCVSMLSASQVSDSKSEYSQTVQPASDSETKALYSSLENELYAFQELLSPLIQEDNSRDRLSRIVTFFWFAADNIKQKLARRASNGCTINKLVEEFLELQTDFHNITAQDIEDFSNPDQQIESSVSSSASSSSVSLASAPATESSTKTFEDSPQSTPRKSLKNAPLHYLKPAYSTKLYASPKQTLPSRLRLIGTVA